VGRLPKAVLKILSALALYFWIGVLCTWADPMRIIPAKSVTDAIGLQASVVFYLCVNWGAVFLLTALIYRFLWL